jgi:hypothetical protein
MRSHVLPLSSFVLFAVVAVAAAGCSASLGDKTDGENGNLRFSYNGRGCLFGCGLDRSALQGSMVTITSEGGDPDVRPTARIVDPAVARVSSQRESCSCTSQSKSSSHSRSVDPGDTCTSTEKKACSLSLDIETTQAGDPKLEIVDGAGSLIDRVTLHVRPAARIDVTVQQGATLVGGVYEVKKGFKVKLESRVFDVDGGEAVFARHGMSFDYADKSIVQPDSAVLVGSTEVEDMIAPGAGDTTVTVKAPGAQKIVRLRVRP